MQNRIIVGVALLLTLSTAVARTFFHNAAGLESQDGARVSESASASNPEVTLELLAALEAEARMDRETWLKRPL